ncbi:family 1 extracellular solute-binding protein, partial [gut metagenome]
ASALLAAMLAGTMMTGCIPQKTSGGTSEKPSDSTAELAAQSFHAEGLPIVDETITFDVAAKSRHNKNFSNLEFFQKLEEKTNVHVEWNMSSDDGWKEKKGLLFAGELPDAFYGQAILTDVDVVKYASQGLLIPLDDLIEKYAPNIKRLLDENDEYRKVMTAPDGHIYSLPNLTELSPKTHDKLFINKTWLDQLNLPIPETVDEFEKTLIAFRDNDMNGNGDKNDEIPFSFLYNRKENGLFSLFGSFGQVDNMDHLI